MDFPALVGNIDLSIAGTGTRMLLGDLDGTGRMDMLMEQPDGGIDDRYIPHEGCCTWQLLIIA